MANTITKYEEFIFEADSPSTVLSAAKLELDKAENLNVFLKDKYNSKLRAAGTDKAKKIQAEIEYLTSRIDYFQKMVPALTKVKSAIDGKLSEVKERRIIGYDDFLFEEESAASLVSAARLEQSKINDEYRPIWKKYREDEAAAAGDEQKKLKLESEYVAKRAEYYQKMVQATTKIKTALEAELSELSQA